MGADSKMNTDIYYIIKIRDRFLSNLRFTTISSGYLCGKIIKTSDARYIFELNGSKAVVEIPSNYIEFIAPSKILWNKS